MLRPAHGVGGIDRDNLPDDEIVEQHADRGEMLLDDRLLEFSRHRLDIGPDMDRLDRGQLVEAVGVAPGEEALTGALVRGAGVVVGDRAEEIGEAFRRAGSDVGDEHRHHDRPAEAVLRIDGRQALGGGRREGFGLGSKSMPVSVT